MSARAAKKKFDERHMNESFEHAREIKFAEDFEIPSAEDDKLSKTANFFGDFYFTGETAGAKEMASKVVNQELREMRERLNWGTLTSTKQIPKEEFQTQLSKSRFLSLFLVMRRVTGKFQLGQKKKAFRNWVEWHKHYMILYRSRPVSRSNPGSRSVSPNNSFRSVRFFHNQSDAGSVSTSSTHNHPRNYRFHGDRNMSPAQLRKELHLHRDIFLTSEDDGLQETLLRRVHPHAANHPEVEEKSRFASPKERAAARKPDVKHAKASVPSHIVKKHIVVSAQTINQNRPDSPSSTVASYTTLGGHRVHAQKKVSAKKLKKELHLHHDMFLTSQDDDVAQALLHHAYAQSPNHPELEYKPNGHSFSDRGAAHSPPVPSHVVPKRSPSPSGDQSAALRARSLSPTRSTAQVGAHTHARDLSPQQLKKELHLHHDLFLTSQDDDMAQAVLYRALPHSPNHAPAEVLSRFASPKRRAAARLEAEKKAAAQAKAAAHSAPHPAAHSRSPSPSRQVAGAPGQLHTNQRSLSPQQLKKDLHLHHDMFLTSEDDVVADALLHKANAHSPNRTTRGNFNFADGAAGGNTSGGEGSAAKKITCRHLDTIAGSRKEAHALHKADPVTHVKAVASGKHHNIAVKSIAPSLYSSGVTSAGLKAFNVSKDKKHDPKPKLSHSPSRVLPVEHAETVGIKVEKEELRAGTPTKTLARALSILVTPASDAVKHDHRVKPHHVLGRTLTALTITGHEAIVGAVVASPQTPEPEVDSESSYDTDSDDELPQQRDSRLSGLDLSKGLSIRTDMATNDGTASVSTSSASPTRRNSFHAPTVSHILKLAHRSDSVEKVASKVKEKRSKVKQTLPKSPHPSQVFTIIPDELIAKRAERRTSFRSPTKSHAIKVAAKLGGDDVGSVLGSVSGSPSSLNKPERRKSFADSLERDSSVNVENGVYSIRTIIPFTGMNNSGASASFLSTATAGPAPSIYGTPGKLVRRGSTVGSMGPNSAPAKVGGGVNYAYPSNSTAKNGAGGTSASKNNGNRANSGVKFEDGGDDASTVQGEDDASVCVYNVDDDLINLFDPTSPKFKKGMTPKNRNKVGTNASAANVGGNSTTSTIAGAPGSTGTPKYRPGSAKHIAMLKKQADDQKTASLNVIFQHLDTHHGKVGKTTSTKVAFSTWRAAVGWFKKVDERVPQSILYLLQVEKEILWRVFCVYCPDKRAIPVSPPVTTVTGAVLSDAAVVRLTTGFSAHHDHHTHAPEVFHAYQDIHATHHATPAEVDAERIKRDAYLHKDIFLHTVDDDIAEVLLHQSHRHAANHPEQGIIVHHEKTQHIHETPVPHHDLTIKLGPHQHEVDKSTLRRDLHLNHDMFLGSQEADVIEVTMHHAHPHAANHPEEGLVGDHGYVHRPAPIVIPPVHHTPSAAHPEKHSDHAHEAGAAHQSNNNNTADENAMLERMNSRTSPPPNTPLYGLFTVVEDEDGREADQSPDHTRTLSPVPKLNYGPNAANSSPAEKEVPILAVPKSMHLQIVPAPLMNGHTEGMPPGEIVALHASTRFKKKLMGIDGLWNLFQDFNVVPYLFNKMKLRELFERCVSIQPDSPAAPVVPENNPLSHMPNFNVYSYDAPGRDDERNSPRSSPRSSPRNSPRSSPRTSPERRPSHDAVAKSLRARSSSPTRRGSTASAASTTSASAKRMDRIIETVMGNGTRRAFKSPDGKVMIKLTSFRAPSAIEIDTTYIAKVTNPRSKAPDVLNAIKMKKKQDDDFAKAIVEANRKAAEEKALAERNRRRAGPNNKPHASLSAQTKASSSPELRTSKSASVPNLKNLTPGTTQSGAVGSAGSGSKRQASPERTHQSPGKSRSIGDLQLYHVEAHSPQHHHPTISFKSFVKLLWEVAASYMDIGEDDAQAIAALRAFVHVLTRYKARMVTKEVEKVLPLLAHDRELGHKATRMF